MPITTSTRRRRRHHKSIGLGGETLDLIRQLEHGFSYAVLARFQKYSGMALGRIAELIRIPPRTLIRRRTTGRLHPEESERLLRIITIFERAVELFEQDVDAARHWLTSASAELAGRSPLEFARTEIGARDVEDLMGRLEHGVFS